MALKETVTIEVEVEGQGLKKLTMDAKALRKALRGVEKPADKTASAFEQNAELAERMRSALGPLGDMFADVTGGADDLATALKSFSLAQAGMAAGLLIGVAALGKFAQGIASTISEIDEMSDALRKRQDPALDDAIWSIKELNDKLEHLSVTYDAQWVLLTSKLTPALGGFITTLDASIPTVASFAGTASNAVMELTSLGAAFKTFLSLMNLVDASSKDSEKGIANLGQSVVDLDENFYDLRDEFGQFAQSDELPVWLHMVSDDSKELGLMLAGLELQTMRTARATKSAVSEYAKVVGTLSGAFEVLRDTGPAAWEDLLGAQHQYTGALEESDVAVSNSMEGFNALAARRSQQYADMTKAADENKVKTVKAENTKTDAAASGVMAVLSMTGSMLSQVQGMYNEQMDQQIAGMRKGSEEHRKALKKQFAANKAMAIAQAAINMALGIGNVWASWGGQPIVAAVLTALVAGVAGAQIGLIAAKKPNFHRGGMLPDERSGFGGRAVTRQNEAEVVITAQGQRGFADAVNALNRGDGGRGGGVTVMLDSRPIRGVVHAMGQADPAYGHRRRS